jgi:hypothetical protein
MSRSDRKHQYVDMTMFRYVLQFILSLHNMYRENNKNSYIHDIK